MNSIQKFSFLCLLPLLMIGCDKKEEIEAEVASTNTITVTVDKAGSFKFDRSTYNQNTEVFSDCYLSFARTTYQTAIRESQNYNVFEIASSDCDVASSTPPFKLKEYFIYMDLLVQKRGAYTASTRENQKFDVTITHKQGRRIKGTFAGKMFRDFGGADTVNVQGAFDIDYDLKVKD